VDWLDPKWASLAFRTDENGKRTAASLADVQKTVRTDARFNFDGTAGGVDMAAQLANEIATSLGRK
jgi:hypothetical protein